MANTIKMTRAERYKRNYGLVRNKYFDSKLAKKYQSYSDEKLYTELGIKVGDKTPQLKTFTDTKRTSGKRNLAKYRYARDLGMDVESAKKVLKYRKEKIDSTYEYLDSKSHKLTNKNKIRRMDAWGHWSSGPGYMPPEVEHLAQQINRDTVVGGKPLESTAKYGYIVAFYMYVENKSFDEIKDLVEPDPHDSYRVYYRTTVSVI